MTIIRTLLHLRLFSAGFLLLCLIVPEPSTPLPESESTQITVYTVDLKGAITPSTMESLGRAIEIASENGAEALLVRLDTPGGLASSMDEMIRTILSSPIPVITYVSPPGAACGSAGVYLMYASHIAAMAPATNIGSATPVMIGPGGSTPGGDKKSDRIPETAGSNDAVNLKRKQLHHAVSQIRSLAEYRKRNIEFAEETVTKAANITSTEALARHVIDALAQNDDELLRKIDGRSVRMLTGSIRLHLKGAKLVPIEQDFRTTVLGILSNPNIAYLLMMIGILGILAEIQHPGAIFPGAVGAVALILGLYAMQSIPINYTGFALIFLGVIFLILEFNVISYGLLTVAGLISIITGSLMLIDSGDELVRLSVKLIITTSVLFSGLVALMVYKAAQTMKRTPASGKEALLKETGETLREVNATEGSVHIHSETWEARTDGKPIPEGRGVRIVSITGLTLKVEELERAPSDPEGSGSSR